MDKSKRIMEHRARSYDRFSALIDKGGNKLLRVLALREGVSIAEYIRRAILARGGLHMVPYPDELQKLDSVTTQEQAQEAIQRLQMLEYSNKIISKVIQRLQGEHENTFIWNATKEDISEMKKTLTEIIQAMEASDDASIYLSESQINYLQRMLANVIKQSQ